MTDERKYGDEEVKEIFDLATTRDEAGRLTALNEAERGLTLAELQEVGLEVGVEPSKIAEAALTLDTRRDTLPRGRSLGMPVSVGRIIQLPRAVTDHEWDLLVTEFRETFAARGSVTSHGGVRMWSNGNLHAYLEPTETGHRLRLRTLNGAALAWNRMGVAGLTVALIMVIMFLTTSLSPVNMEITMMLLTGLGGGALISNLFRLPLWAREREGQMEYLAGRVGALIEEEPREEDGPSPDSGRS